MMVITSAMPQETDAVVSCLKTTVPAAAACPAWRGDGRGTVVTALCTGVGQDAVKAGLGELLSQRRAVAVVSTGFAGALTADLRAGDIVLCDTIVADDEPGHFKGDPALLARAVQAGALEGSRVRRGTGVTVPVVAANWDVKTALRERAGADICEMEDYWVARLAAEHGLPFLSVRVVLDEMTVDISDFLDFMGPEGVRPFKVAAYFLRHPGRLGAALRSFRQYRRAQASLRHFMHRFLTTKECQA
jgi:adenosylhomocysteine nucleosidase